MKRFVPAGVPCLLIVLLFFGYLASVMGLSNMLNTVMKTAHDLLINTVFYLMGICVVTGALGKIFVEFGVVDLFQRLLRPIMKPLFNLPGVASLGATLTFLSDNPAIISLSKDVHFSRYFKKYQLISLTNFGTAFGMGLIVIVFMVGQGYFAAPFIGLFGAVCGCMISTRMMQYFVCKDYPQYRIEDAVAPLPAPPGGREGSSANVTSSPLGGTEEGADGLFIRILNALLDGGKSGVEIGLAIIPGVLIISTIVMMLTFGGSAEGVDAQGNPIITYTGGAYEGTQLLPWLSGKINFIFEWLFGFEAPELVAFPITALGAVGAALGLIPEFTSKGIIDGNAIAVCTAMGMCWSGYLSTHTAMLDSMGYRNLLSRAFLSHFFGGLGAGIVAHWTFVGIMAIVALFDPNPVWTAEAEGYQCQEQEHSMKLELTAYDDGTFVIKNWYGEEGQELKFTVNEEDSTINIVNAYAENAGYSFVRISKDNLRNEPAYAALYTNGDYSEFFATQERGSLYVFADIYDGQKRRMTRGYYEVVWGGAPRQTSEAEKGIQKEIEQERVAAEIEADSIMRQHIVDSLLMRNHIAE